MHFARAILILVWLGIALAVTARGQGGPPMITDDPGTPGSGKWENNFAFTFEHRSGESSYDLPMIDLNYGVGDHIQLTLQTAPTVLQKEQQGPVAGLGGVEAAVKWRFLDEQKSGFDMSMFPRIVFNIQQSSARRGLSEEGTRLQIPFQAARTFGKWHADVEVGPLVTTVGRGEWLYGAVAGYDVNNKTVVMAEVHTTSRMNFTRNTVTLNFGLRRELDEHHVLIASIGHEIHAPDESLALIGYLGVQFLY